MHLEISVLSKPGGRAYNEDAYGFWAGSGICFCVLSDGAGGQGGGDVASKLALMRRMSPSSFSEALGALTGEHSFALNMSEDGPPGFVSDTSSIAMSLRSASLNTVRTRCAM